MKGKLKGIALNRDNSQDITITVQEDFREEFDKLMNSDVEVEIKKASGKRSLEANAYLWSLCDRISKASSKFSTDGKNEMYREAIREKGVWKEVFVREDAVDTFINGWSNHGIGWFVDVMDEFRGKHGETFKQLHVYFGSSTYSADELGCVIDYLVMIANDLGISTMTPKEEEKMLIAWGKKYEKKFGEKKDEQVNYAADGAEAMLSLW